MFADFPRLTSGKTTWKQLKKICPKIVRLRVGSIKNVSANISKIIDAFGPQLVEFQIKEDFKATSRTFLQICEGMPKLESLTLASAPNVWAHGWRVAKSSGVEYFNNPTLCFSAMSHLQYLRHIDFSLENWMPESYSDPTLNSCFDVLHNAGGIPTLETCKLDYQYKVSYDGILFLVMACPRLREIAIRKTDPAVEYTTEELRASLVNIFRQTLLIAAQILRMKILGCKQEDRANRKTRPPIPQGRPRSLSSSLGLRPTLTPRADRTPDATHVCFSHGGGKKNTWERGFIFSNVLYCYSI